MQNKRQIILIFLTILASLIFWLSIKNALYNNTNLFLTWILPIIIGIFMLSCLGTLMLLVKNRSFILPIIASIILIFFIIFKFKILYLIAAPITIAGIWFAYERIKLEKNQRIKFQLHRILLRGLPIIISSFIILISLAYYFAPNTQNYKLEITIPKWVVELSSKPLNMVLPSIVPGYKSDSEFFDLLPKEARLMLEQELKIDLKDKQGLEEFLQAFINQKIELFLSTSEYAQYVPIALAFSLFFALNALNIFLCWIVIALLFLVIFILKKINIINIEKQSIKIEKLIF